jgi:hypothetical protein
MILRQISNCNMRSAQSESDVVEFKNENIISIGQLLVRSVKLNMASNNLHAGNKKVPDDDKGQVLLMPWIAQSSMASKNISDKCLCPCDCKFRECYDYMCLAPSNGKKGNIMANGDIDFRHISHCRHFATCPIAGTTCQNFEKNKFEKNNLVINKIRKQSRSCCDNLHSFE